MLNFDYLNPATQASSQEFAMGGGGGGGSCFGGVKPSYNGFVSEIRSSLRFGPFLSLKLAEDQKQKEKVFNQASINICFRSHFQDRS